MSEVEVPDQKAMWNRKHGAGEHDELRDEHTEFAEMVAGYLRPASTILELGCGTGRDARYFAKQEHTVIATDFSVEVVRQNNERMKKDGLKFEVLDMAQDLPYAKQMDAVYAYLSLHYFSDVQTRKLFQDIYESLKEDGVLAFTCMGIDSVQLVNAEVVEKDLYVGKTSGHVLRVFTLDYVKELSGGLFSLELLDEVDQQDFSSVCKVVRCIARKV
jgi:SAM-dependent methyltransferase